MTLHLSSDIQQGPRAPLASLASSPPRAPCWGPAVPPVCPRLPLAARLSRTGEERWHVWARCVAPPLLPRRAYRGRVAGDLVAVPAV